MYNNNSYGPPPFGGPPPPHNYNQGFVGSPPPPPLHQFQQQNTYGGGGAAPYGDGNSNYGSPSGAGGFGSPPPVQSLGYDPNIDVNNNYGSGFNNNNNASHYLPGALNSGAYGEFPPSNSQYNNTNQNNTYTPTTEQQHTNYGTGPGYQPQPMNNANNNASYQQSPPQQYNNPIVSSPYNPPPSSGMSGGGGGGEVVMIVPNDSGLQKPPPPVSGGGGGVGGGGSSSPTAVVPTVTMLMQDGSHSSPLNGAPPQGAKPGKQQQRVGGRRANVPTVAAKDIVTDTMRREKALVYAESLRTRLTKENVPLPSAARILLEADGIRRDEGYDRLQNQQDQEMMQAGGAAGAGANSRLNDPNVDFFDGVRLEEYRVMYNMCDTVYKVGTKEFGPGIMYYFEFVKFLGIMTLILAAFQIAIWGKFVSDNSLTFTTGNTTTLGYRYFIGDFMITAYDEEVRTSWFGVSITSIVLTFLAAPIYFLFMQCFASDSVSTSSVESFANASGEVEDRQRRIVRFDNATCDIDVSCHYRSSFNLAIRRIIAFIFLLCILGIQVAISYFLTQNQNEVSFGISMAISLISTTIASLFKFIAPRVTEFMLLTDFDWWKRWHTTSILAIRMGSLIAVFAAKDYPSSADTICSYDLIGEQFISIILVEIILSPIMEISSAMLWRRNAQWIARVMSSRLSDQENLYAWDLADYYRNILYRHFVTLMAMIVVPMVAGLACVGYFMQFWVDKFMLFKICGRPRRVAGSQKYFLTFMLAVVAVCALLTPYAGTMFMLSGITRDLSKLCTFP